jgi:hypothetical protein
MDAPKLALDTNFALAIRQVYQMVGLWMTGLGESDEADRLRDESDGPWYAMTTEQQEYCGQLSESLDGPAIPKPPMSIKD